MSDDERIPAMPFSVRVDDVFRLVSQDVIVTGEGTSGELERATAVVVLRADRMVATALASLELPRGATAGVLSARLSNLEGDLPRSGDRIESRAR